MDSCLPDISVDLFDTLLNKKWKRLKINFKKIISKTFNLYVNVLIFQKKKKSTFILQNKWTGFFRMGMKIKISFAVCCIPKAIHFYLWVQPGMHF